MSLRHVGAGSTILANVGWTAVTFCPPPPKTAAVVASSRRRLFTVRAAGAWRHFIFPLVHLHSSWLRRGAEIIRQLTGDAY